MKWTFMLAGAVALAVLLGAACGGGEPDPGEGRLTQDSGRQLCVYDAKVTLNPGGVLREVRRVGTATEDLIEPGIVVEGAVEEFPNGIGVPIAVYRDEAGVWRNGYASCEPTD